VTEGKIRSHFEELMNKDDLQKVPISVLHRLINYDIGVSLFGFLMKCLDKIGSCASILFDKFDISQLDTEQLEELESKSELNWCFVYGFERSQVCEILSRTSRRDDDHVKLIRENEDCD
jgi:hypothetical protein